MSWTDITRKQRNRGELRYPSDLRDEEWAVIEPFFPPPRHGGRPRTTKTSTVKRSE
jgi:putative transposase